jgi:hypothetical protein
MVNRSHCSKITKSVLIQKWVGIYLDHKLHKKYKMLNHWMKTRIR